MRIFGFVFFLFFLQTMQAQHPRLTLTPAGVEKIKSQLGQVPLFDSQLEATITEVQQAIAVKMDVPIPKDMAGGHSHEQHKKNYKLMHKAGNLYQITGDEVYAEYVKEMLMVYGEMYPTLGLHPSDRSYARGKLFWQCLNDANWLVFTSQAYDCIYNYLSKKERKFLEEDLFIPYANFLSEGNPRFFNRIHNHSTWANAAVGMIAIVMDHEELLDKALYGLKDDGINANETDNDGGYFKIDGITTAGFIAQLDYSFSPDGYFAEGPYYLRYAIFPFLVFGHALHNNKPELDVFNYRDGILKKATNACLQLTDSRGQFFAINDAQKGMSYHAYELLTAVDLMYYVDESQTYLLDWAALQEGIVLNETGFSVAAALANHEVKAPQKKSTIFTDGVDGKGGGVAMLRTDQLEVLFKFSTQGMGHGHFDRLSYALFDQYGEVVQDYGAVRWVNIDQKAGGRYLPENKTFGKQSIGHNTAVINQESHYGGSVKKADKFSPELVHYDFGKEESKFITAVDANAYPGTEMRRSLLLLDDPDLSGSLLIDVLDVNSNEAVSIDLPFWYKGALLKTSFDCKKELSQLKPLGTKNGYQHIWQEGECNVESDYFSFNWLTNDQFYTLHSTSNSDDQVILGRAGANDPNFNLRPDPVMIQRRTGKAENTFVQLIEAHGSYNRISEVPRQPYSKIKGLQILHNDANYLFLIFHSDTQEWKVMISKKEQENKTNHKLTVEGEQYEWEGHYRIIKRN